MSEKEKITDWTGLNVNRDSCPACERHDCFACAEGHCTVLRIPDGRCTKEKGGGDDDECRFYQTAEQVTEACIRGHRRLKEMGRQDLIYQYADMLIRTGAMKEELQEADREGEQMEQFRRANYNEQMDRAAAGGTEDICLREGA